MVKAIEIHQFEYTYPGFTKPALILDELVVESGEICWVMGLNEAGKTTLCRSLTGIIPHFFHGSLKGSIRLNDQLITSLNISDIAGIAGFIMDDPFDQLTRATYTVHDEIAFGLQNVGLPADEILERVYKTMEELNIVHLADRIPTSLSGGEQQRVAIASIFARQPNIFVMDEATSQLDPQGCESIFGLVRQFKEMGKTIVIVEPKLDKISQYADRLVVLHEGRLVANESVKGIIDRGIFEEIGYMLPSYPALAKELKQIQLYDGELTVTLAEAKDMVQGVLHDADH